MHEGGDGEDDDVDVVVDPVDVLGDRRHGLLEADLAGRGLAGARQRRQSEDHAQGGEEPNPHPVAQAPLDHQDRSHVCCHACRPTSYAGRAGCPARRPPAPSTSYLTNCPVVPCGIGPSQQVPAHLAASRARHSPHLRPICPELPIASPSTMADIRLKAGFLRHFHAQASCAEALRAYTRPRWRGTEPLPGPISAGFIGEITDIPHGGSRCERFGCVRLRAIGRLG